MEPMLRVMELNIHPFAPEYAPAFKKLNLNWLESYFEVEPHDEWLLDHCEEAIIDTGGAIFFAVHRKKVIGCYALIHEEEGKCELGKMAVSPKYQGLGIGQKLLEHAITQAKNKGYRYLELYSSRRLDTALHLYKKYGFEEVPLESPNPYTRSDIKMSLFLTP